MLKSEVPRIKDCRFWVYRYCSPYQEGLVLYCARVASSRTDMIELQGPYPYRDTKAEAEADLDALRAFVEAGLNAMREVAD